MNPLSLITGNFKTTMVVGAVAIGAMFLLANAGSGSNSQKSPTLSGVKKSRKKTKTIKV
jgi:hypothetical protein